MTTFTWLAIYSSVAIAVYIFVSYLDKGEID